MKVAGDPEQLLLQALRCFNFACPHNDDAPAEFPQKAVILPIPGHITFKLRPPVGLAALGLVTINAIVLVPEATPYLNHRPVFWEHDIGPPGQPPLVESEPKPESV